MTRGKDAIDPREMADRIFDAGCDQRQIAHALNEIENYKDIFLNQLALRTAIMYSENVIDYDVNVHSVPVSLLDEISKSVENIISDGSLAYDTGSLSIPSTWLKAQDALGGDVNLVMKLADGHLRPPKLSKGMRYLADALGVTMDQIRSHFERGQAHVSATDEFSSKGKPTSHGTEAFEDAVREAGIPDAIRRQMIGE